MRFFLTLNNNGEVGFSPFREGGHTDRCGRRPVSYLSVPLSYGTIQLVQERLSRREPLRFWPKSVKLQDPKLKVSKILQDLGWAEADLVWREDNSSSGDELKVPSGETWESFQRLTWGRQLSQRDLRRLAQDLNVKEGSLLELAHFQVEQGQAHWVPAVGQSSSGWVCQRCGERDVEEWPASQGKAATCKSCANMGPCTSQDVLYRDGHVARGSCFTGGNEETGAVVFAPHWPLTRAQRMASEQVLAFSKESGRGQDRALLWAACGAGKTEVCFPSAAWALADGKAVLFAAPRQDVVQDIAPRLQQDFPACPIQVLTGTSNVKFQSGKMVLATTHQVLRFWRAFDLIFLDEMDAFPYQGNRALVWGLHQALRPGGKIVALTATPSREALQAVKQGRMRLIRLPARHHRKALPVPVWEKSRSLLEPGGSPERWLMKLKELRVQGPVLVFVPKISWVAPWVQSLRQGFPDWQIEGSYSSDPQRSAKIEGLRRNQFDLFVATTILERGVTLPGIQVTVLGADHPVFDERALVQMAGRAGRTREFPQGNVLFIAARRTKAMETAVQWIKEQNQLAWESGLIDV